jgi:methionyl-tRNA formyltransferase
MARVIFMGTPEYAVPSLLGLIDQQQVVAVVTQPDRRGGRGRRHLIPPPVKRAAQPHGIPVIQTRTLRTSDPAGGEAVRLICELEPDVIVVAAFGQILRRNLLDLPPHGCINVHASLLPKYRGASPISAAILEGEEETGVTIMLMDRGMDTGDILAARSTHIEPDDTAGTLTPRLAELGADALLETLPRWLAGEIEPTPQGDAQATYCWQVTKSDGRIDWTQPAERISRMIRAYDPWPGVFTECNGRRLQIASGYAIPDWTGDAVPGQIVETDEGAGVATGRGALVLLDVQPAGKRVMSCEAFACGQREFVGTCLGSEER